MKGYCRESPGTVELENVCLKVAYKLYIVAEQVYVTHKNQPCVAKVFQFFSQDFHYYYEGCMLFARSLK